MAPRMSPAAIALAVLSLRCSALQVASDTDVPGVCEGEATPYEALHPLSGICNVFCVPAGVCIQKVQEGELANLGISEPGTCVRHGFTQDTEFGNTTARMAQWLQSLMGPCRGLSLAKKYKKPAATVPGSETGKRTCPYEQVPFEGISRAYPGMCSRFCVPEGACQERTMKGGFAYLGIIGPGDCESKGFTHRAQMTNLTQNTQSYLMALLGPCKGMSLTKFQRAPVPGTEPGGPLCTKEKAPFAAIAPHNPHLCSVYCVPEGACVGKVQTGAMNHFGLIGEGNCRKLGFTEPLPHPTNTSKFLVGGPCQGIERFNFLKPGIAAE